MGIGKFVEGYFGNKGDLSKEKQKDANARLAIDRAEKREAINNFIMEYELQKLPGYENLDDKDIENLKNFVESKAKIAPEDEDTLKNEVKIKAEKIIQEKFQEAA